MNERRILLVTLVILMCAGLTWFLSFPGGSSASTLPPDGYPPPETAAPISGMDPTLMAVSPTPAPPEESSPAALAALEYIARVKSLPVDALEVASDQAVEFPNIGRQYQSVKIYEKKIDGKGFGMLVDLSTYQVIEDPASIEAQEDKARFEKYGKLQPALHERLRALKDDDEVTVAVWLKAGPGLSAGERAAAAAEQLAAKYPEARAAVESGKKLMDVDDRALSEQIEREYIAALEAPIAQMAQPLMEALAKMGYASENPQGLPAIFVSLAKKDLPAIQHREDVGAIDLAEGGRLLTSQNSATSTDRVPQVWSRSYDGAGVKIAILEDGNVDFNSPANSLCPDLNNCILHPGPTRPAFNGIDAHTTLVASVAAGSHPLYQGVAPGATVISAGIQGSGLITRQDVVDALAWAVDLPQSSDIVNASFGWCLGTNQLDVLDKVFDYYARARNRMVVVSAGNIAGGCPYDYVQTPAKGWNVLSVGAANDSDDPDWSNDSMADLSAWVDPASPNNSREKPEVVAPGAAIQGIALDGSLHPNGPVSGTSFAAPQVSGLAALLIDRTSALRLWPEASRAIIMASAVHNVEGPPGVPIDEDVRDGAGSIDAALADLTAANYNTSTTPPCNGPCWWGKIIDNSNFPVGSYLNRYFLASRGERVRVAISWWSNSDCVDTYTCTYDRLDTDLDLRIFAPNGSEIAFSRSLDNNYELVDFLATQSGTYRIGVFKFRASETSNSLGIAFVKDATYLPDLMNNYNNNGRVSEFYLRNDGAQDRYVHVHYFNADGSTPPVASDVCYLQPNQTCYIPVNSGSPIRIPNGGVRSAIVDGSEDVSVITANQKDSPAANGAYTGLSNLQARDTAYVPIVLRKRTTASGTGNSEFMVQNVSPAARKIWIHLIGYPGSGFGNYTRSATLASGATYRYILANESSANVPDQWYGSAIVTAEGPVVVLSNLLFGSSTVQTINAFPSWNVGASWMVPQFTSRLANGLSTVVSVQNVSGGTIGANTVQLNCIKDAGSPDPASLNVTNGSTSIPNNGGFSFNPVIDTVNFPANWYGSCSVTAPANVVVFVQMRYVGGTGNPADAAGYNAELASGVTKTIIFPRIRRQPDGTGLASTVGIHNLSQTDNANVTLYYKGSTNLAPLSFTIAPGASLLRNHRFDDIPVNWTGSLVVVSEDQYINGYAQLKDIYSTQGNGDTFMAYDAIPR